MRVTRTIRDFENALLTLLEKNSFEHLTVDQICKEALLHRSSFYRYFSDKYDLLEQTLNAQINKLTDNTDSEDDIIKQLISYIEQHKEVIRHLAPNSARSSLYTEILTILSQILLERRNIKTNDPIVIALQKSDNPEMLAYVLSGAIIGTFYWWQGNNYDVPKEDVIKFARATARLLIN
ncbi:TetR/AcrR family transcriptional regulator [Lactobacillus sp. 0.1XD8-4]|uniref:TetR/AcrR family transcriptional regulator n=1 Tax=Limosilactobacillus walteri TaxID=2268022 RepID=A0ABR8P4Y0_9LACO|nr:TetR/AcrR family transcriptional regulator [uncultured Limosilactobacillus sp.]MBD5805741.1 TetR/AcrR family transcriptional regulator [Limosilactobacillus walteri]MRN05820.1 TetR/AcrR family transcriptional regulator [Lactobacillus sp. 0.1XD8-4]